VSAIALFAVTILACSESHDVDGEEQGTTSAALTQSLRQPFAQTAYICQSYRGFSHAGNYPLDIGLTPTSCNAGSDATGGATIVAPASGTVSKLPTPGLGDYMCIRFTGGGAVALGHVKPASGIASGTAVTKGQKVATVAHANDASSANNGIAHLHFEAFDGIGCYNDEQQAFTGEFRLDCAPDLPFNAGSGYYNGTKLTPCDGSGGSGGSGGGADAGVVCPKTPVAGAENETFKDMPDGSLGQAEAIAIYEAKITSGCSDDPLLFCPTCILTRGQAVTMLVRAAKIDTANPPATPTFSDVPTSHQFFASIEAAAKAGITAGCGGGKFCPDGFTTRGQLATFVVRTMGWPVVSPSSPSFPLDVPLDHQFYASIETAVEHCLTSGCKAGSFCPDELATRVTAAIFIARAFDLDGLNPCTTSGTGGAAGAGSTGGVSGEAGALGQGGWTNGLGGLGSGGTSGSGGAKASASDDEPGCACDSSSPEGGGSSAFFALLVAFALGRRRSVSPSGARSPRAPGRSDSCRGRCSARSRSRVE
jgi:MYXO-CTERM domain-containing protein